jgi:hypothetical protein
MRRKIFLWAPHGRLGNHAFQFAEILRLKTKNDVILCTNTILRDLFEIESNRLVQLIPKKCASEKINDLVNKWLRHLVKFGIIGSITESKTGNRTSRARHGIIPRVYHVDGFFQSRLHDAVQLRIRDNLQARASNYFSSRGIHVNDVTVGIHIRLGDYKNWRVYGKENASLPPSYYIKAARLMKSEFPNCKFVVFSDDSEAVESYLPGIQFDRLPDSDPLLDFSGLSFCTHLIISASSFSWWAAVTSWRNDKIVIAPKYWAGFRSGEWYPSYIDTEKFTYLDVELD